jgi:hypothetical protein
MAFNPPLLAGTSLPAGIQGEFFILERAGIELSLDTQTREHGKQVLRPCRLYLTTLRLCLVAPAPNASGLQAFDIPLQGISAESFEQPFFGANYLALTVAPVPGRGLASPAKVKVTFNEGGCGVFLKVFFSLMARYKDSNAAARASFLAPPAMQSFMTQVAYVDRACAARARAQPCPLPTLDSLAPLLSPRSQRPQQALCLAACSCASAAQRSPCAPGLLFRAARRELRGSAHARVI